MTVDTSHTRFVTLCENVRSRRPRLPLLIAGLFGAFTMI